MPRNISLNHRHSCCRYCDKREIGCHGKCPEYQAECKAREKYRETHFSSNQLRGQYYDTLYRENKRAMRRSAYGHIGQP